ncbi:unnamed protein product [Pieris macdunnoughi]|uniref:Uncharacterized protein n=1 Tax=Pieris macdunnoughi TaxID=345717 RepID=A0A821SLC2_9NEOP|nr:unnamed protein product [Pieris macdunnoughi]
MMKLLLVVCLAVASFTSGAVVRPTNRSSLSVGYITNGDRLLHRQYLNKQPVPNAVQYQDFIFPKTLTLGLHRGGVGYNYATVRVQSARGLGYYYVIDVWGR